VSAPATVDQYLTELAAGLAATGRVRSRALAEAEDHLREDIAARQAGGLPPAAARQAAFQAFGPADVVARGITEAVAQGAVRRLFVLGAALFAVVTVASDLVTSDFAHLTASWLSDGVGTVFVWVVAQVALVAGAVSVTRAVAHTLSTAGAAQLYIMRGMVVVVLCSVLALPVDAIGIFTGPGAARLAPALLVAAATAAGLTAAAAALCQARRAGACLGFLGAGQVPPATITGDIAGAAARLSAAAQRRVPAAAPLLRTAARCAAGCRTTALRRAPWLADWLDTRRHPWRFAFLALAPLTALTVTYAIVQAALTGAGWTITTFGYPMLLALAECTLALAGYATLGPYLALRHTARAVTIQPGPTPRHHP
jgi:hypothetical protein